MPTVLVAVMLKAATAPAEGTCAAHAQACCMPLCSTCTGGAATHATICPCVSGNLSFAFRASYQGFARLIYMGMRGPVHVRRGDESSVRTCCFEGGLGEPRSRGQRGRGGRLPGGAARLPEGNALRRQRGRLGLEVVLLRADDAPRAADADVADGLLRCESVVLHHVCADENARPPQARLAVHCQRACAQALENKSITFRPTVILADSIPCRTNAQRTSAQA